MPEENLTTPNWNRHTGTTQFRQVYRRTFHRMPLRCSNDNNPGIFDDREPYKDYSGKETTPGQLRIEQHLLKFLNRTSNVLHVGVGNSKFAARFATLANQIV